MPDASCAALAVKRGLPLLLCCLLTGCGRSPAPMPAGRTAPETVAVTMTAVETGMLCRTTGTRTAEPTQTASAVTETAAYSLKTTAKPSASSAAEVSAEPAGSAGSTTADSSSSGTEAGTAVSLRTTRTGSTAAKTAAAGTEGQTSVQTALTAPPELPACSAAALCCIDDGTLLYADRTDARIAPSRPDG